MLHLKPQQRAVLIETFREVGNLSAGAMILGQFVGERPWSVWVLLAGVGAWITLIGIAVRLAGDEQ